MASPLGALRSGQCAPVWVVGTMGARALDGPFVVVNASPARFVWWPVSGTTFGGDPRESFETGMGAERRDGEPPVVVRDVRPIAASALPRSPVVVARTADLVARFGAVARDRAARTVVVHVWTWAAGAAEPVVRSETFFGVRHVAFGATGRGSVTIASAEPRWRAVHFGAEFDAAWSDAALRWFDSGGSEFKAWDAAAHRGVRTFRKNWPPGADPAGCGRNFAVPGAFGADSRAEWRRHDPGDRTVLVVADVAAPPPVAPAEDARRAAAGAAHWAAVCDFLRHCGRSVPAWLAEDAEMRARRDERRRAGGGPASPQPHARSRRRAQFLEPTSALEARAVAAPAPVVVAPAPAPPPPAVVVVPAPAAAPPDSVAPAPVPARVAADCVAPQKRERTVDWTGWEDVGPEARLAEALAAPPGWLADCFGPPERDEELDRPLSPWP